MGRITAIIACLLCCASAFAAPVQTFYINNNEQIPPENGPGYLFTYESFVQSPGEDGGVTYTDWYYDYYIENNSTDHAMSTWTWSYAGHSGSVMVNPHASKSTYGDAWPLAASASPASEDTAYREESFEDASGLFRVPSVLTWNDGHQSFFDVFVELNLVPEPSTVAALAFGLCGMACSLVRRRIQLH